MSSLIHALVLCASMSAVKAEMVAKYPAYERQIRQVGMPSVGYRNRVWFDWQLKSFVKGRTNLFERKQILVKRYKRAAKTQQLLIHELRHYVSFAAGLPDEAHRRIDRR